MQEKAEKSNQCENNWSNPEEDMNDVLEVLKIAKTKKGIVGKGHDYA